MRTPAGRECRHYYEDFHRGRDKQECRLIKRNPNSLAWKPTDCQNCPIPDILNANASPNMELTLTVDTKMFGLRRTMNVTAHCTKHDIGIEDPYIGCPLDNQEKKEALDIFRQALEQDDD
jgi:hypothetical protein